LTQYIKRPVVPVRYGKKAINALCEYVEALKTVEKNSGLRENQKAALIRIAQTLISTLESEEHAKAYTQSIDIAAQMKRIKSIIHHSLQELAQNRTEKPDLPDVQLYSHLTAGFVK
jgi:hypothetical protein